MISRSTTDHIDVGKVAEYFGGGGHLRAAASLIRERTLDEVCEEFYDVLPKFIKPPINVEQIVSRGPQLLSPDTSAEEAAIKMQRFGYEGYPIVKNGEVIGLLTRRAVDRAITHRLNLTADHLMESGNYFVTPEDSIDYVQKIMTETGWGQLPVVDNKTREIIGIVTRTDLLKTLAPEVKLPEEQNLASKLEVALPIDRINLLKAIADVAREQHAAFYIVGGFVRDLLLGSPSLDFDLVVEGNAIELAFELSKRYGGRVTSHSRFGTAKWHLDEKKLSNQGLRLGNDDKYPKLEAIDLVSARTEFYTHPTALPHVERGSIKLDLHRRDFTINTLALRLDGKHYGELHDYWGGLNDLQEGLVRVLHSLSFVDDPTRILRAVRFEQRFGFEIEERTLELLKEAIPLLDRLSGDRIRHELDHIFIEKNAAKIFNRLNELNLIQVISPHLSWDSWLAERISLLYEINPAEKWSINLKSKKLRYYLGYIFLMMRLGDKQRHDVNKRLKLSTDLTKNISFTSKLYKIQGTELKRLDVSEFVDVMDETPVLARYAFYLATDDLTIKKRIERYIDYWQYLRPSITGEDLLKLGLKPGPQYKKILKNIRDAWLNELIQNRDDEMKLLNSEILTWKKKNPGKNSKLDQGHE
jgi:tRNA nucleotidyltransferase (CCA-adding enzyme)